MKKAHPESAFGRSFKPLDTTDISRTHQRRLQTSKQRDEQLAKGNTGTIWGLSAANDEQIAKTARIRKPSSIG